MKKIFVILYLISTLSFLPSSALALSGSDFNPGRIIDDLVFFNKNSMSVTQIQNFLNSKVPTCDTNHTGFTGSTGTIYSSPFICLKDFYENPDAPYTVSFTYKNTSGVDTAGNRTYYENNSYRYTSLTPVYTNGDYTQGYSLKGTMTNVAGVKPAGAISAAQIIYNAAQTYNINPQVLLVTLQKEQGLITDTWPASWQYQAAMGYGCPDTAPCSAGYAGFSKQVISTAYQFRRYTDSPDSYNFKGGTTRYVQYNPTSSCGGSNLYLQNQATANLYNYTPYQPNSGALINMSDYSSGSTSTCGAYGNRNFFWYFTKWFNSTYSSLIKDTYTNKVYLVSGNDIFYVPTFDMISEYGFYDKDIRLTDTKEVSAYIQRGELSLIVKSDSDTDADGSTVYFISKGKRLPINSIQQFNNMGFRPESITYLKYSDLIRLELGDNLQNFIRAKDGSIYKVESGKKRYIFSYDTFLAFNVSGLYSVLSDYSMGMFDLGKALIDGEAIAKDEKGSIYYIRNDLWTYIQSVDSYKCLGLDKLKTYNLKNSVSVSTGDSAYGSCFVKSNGTGSKYFANQYEKIEYISDWGELDYLDVSENFLDKMNTVVSSNNSIFKNTEGSLYKIYGGKKHYIPNMNTFSNKDLRLSDILMINNNMKYLNDGSSILSDNQLIIDGLSVYVYNQNSIYYINSINYLSEYLLNLSTAIKKNLINIDDYTPVRLFVPIYSYDSSLYINTSDGNILINDIMAKGFLGNSSIFIPTYSNIIGKLQQTKTLNVFVKTIDNNSIYYIKDGIKHKINSWSKFIDLGGTIQSITVLNALAIDYIPSGSDV